MQGQRTASQPSIFRLHYLYLLLCFLTCAAPGLGPATASESASPRITIMHTPYTPNIGAVNASISAQSINQNSVLARQSPNNSGGLGAFFGGSESKGESLLQLAGAAGLGEAAPIAAGGGVITEVPVAVARTGAHSVWVRQQAGAAASWRAAAAAALAAMAATYIMLLCFRKLAEKRQHVESRSLADESGGSGCPNPGFVEDEYQREADPAVATEVWSATAESTDGHNHERETAEPCPKSSPVANNQEDKTNARSSSQPQNITSENDPDTKPSVECHKDEGDRARTSPTLGQTLDSSAGALDVHRITEHDADMSRHNQLLTTDETDIRRVTAHNAALARRTTDQQNDSFAGESNAHGNAGLQDMTQILHGSGETSTTDIAEKTAHQIQESEGASGADPGVPTLVDEPQGIRIGMIPLEGAQAKKVLSKTLSTTVGYSASVRGDTAAGCDIVAASADAANATYVAESRLQQSAQDQNDSVVVTVPEVNRSRSTMIQQLCRRCFDSPSRNAAYVLAASALIFIGLSIHFESAFAFAGTGITLTICLFFLVLDFWQLRRRQTQSQHCDHEQGPVEHKDRVDLEGVESWFWGSWGPLHPF